MYIRLSIYFFWREGGGVKIKKLAYVLEGGGGGLSKNEQGGGRGSKIGKFERTYFLNAPLSALKRLDCSFQHSTFLEQFSKSEANYTVI